ncbi:thiamine pyrophosphate-binding protein [Rhizobium sp. CFBP 8762]|uniref:thiamine pyrophosphate-binding protein n=1 Tax=Rhizobium sp. CFBP 8762 TaxID=2775279 RepID=UPI001785CD42|nr:thiamine pyrophosphate-binding protein [Rhizobium sp. CFBP 8762]MBD8555361.1 thiamine pyrophosphate-binding protein [Rhizobium sp. CFBP 8762]
MPRTCVSVITRMIESLNVTHVFGISGGPIVPLVVEFDQSKLKTVLAKHEQGAVMMADGYARVSGKIGVTFATSGPGATNSVTAMMTAHADSSPILLMTGQVSQKVFGKGSLQEGSGALRTPDIVGMFKSITNYSAMLPGSELTRQYMKMALRHALCGRKGTVHLCLPADVLKGVAEDDTDDTFEQEIGERWLPDAEKLQTAARLLRQARRPVILAGHGINLSRAWQPLQDLAEALGGNDIEGKGHVSRTAPLSLGVFGMAVSQIADDTLLGPEPDVLFVVGSSLGEWQTSGWNPALRKGRTFIHLDIDPTELGKSYIPDVALVGDTSLALSNLTELVGAGKAEPKWPARINTVRSARTLQGDAPVLKPQTVAASLSEMAEDSTILFVDIGNCISWSADFFQAAPGTYHVGIGMGTMGHAVAAAIGGKLAAPDKTVVALVGDGAFLMTGTEVHTAVEYGIAVIWIILNNSGHGMVYNGETLIFSQFETRVDFAEFARSLGARGKTVRTLDEFETAFLDARQANCPYVIDAHVDLEEVPTILLRRVGMLKKYFSADDAQTS